MRLTSQAQEQNEQRQQAADHARSKSQRKKNALDQVTKEIHGKHRFVSTPSTAESQSRHSALRAELCRLINAYETNLKTAQETTRDISALQERAAQDELLAGTICFDFEAYQSKTQSMEKELHLLAQDVDLADRASADFQSAQQAAEAADGTGSSQRARMADAVS